MQNTTVILAGLALLAYACLRRPKNSRRAWFQQLKGWQKIVGVVAVLLTLLIAINPEFLALGLLGDTTFIDLFILLLSLQMHQYAAQAIRAFAATLSRGVRSLAIPSPGFSYILFVLTIGIASAFYTLQRTVNRLLS